MIGAGDLVPPRQTAIYVMYPTAHDIWTEDLPETRPNLSTWNCWPPYMVYTSSRYKGEDHQPGQRSQGAVQAVVNLSPETL